MTFDIMPTQMKYPGPGKLTYTKIHKYADRNCADIQMSLTDLCLRLHNQLTPIYEKTFI